MKKKTLPCGHPRDGTRPDLASCFCCTSPGPCEMRPRQMSPCPACGGHTYTDQSRCQHCDEERPASPAVKVTMAGSEPLVIVDGLYRYLGGDAGPEGEQLEEALRDGDAVAAVNATAKLQAKLQPARASYTQAERARKRREHDRSGFEYVAQKLVTRYPRKTHQQRWDALHRETALEFATDRYLVYPGRTEDKVQVLIQEEKKPGGKLESLKYRGFLPYLTKAKKDQT